MDSNLFLYLKDIIDSMRGLRAVILVLAIISSAVLFASAASAASGDMVKIYYTDVPGIQVDFPYGKEIKSGSELIIITSSYIYDMEKTGIMFYKCGPDGKPDRTTTISLNHYSTSSGNTVTHVFSNLTTDIEIDFTDLVELSKQEIVVPEEPEEKNKIAYDGDMLTTIVMLASVFLAAAMLAIMVMVIRMLDSVPKEPDKIQ